jgi:hypothetical protein
MMGILIGAGWISLSNFQLKDYVNPRVGFFLKKGIKNMRKTQSIKRLKRFANGGVVPEGAEISRLFVEQDVAIQRDR